MLIVHVRKSNSDQYHQNGNQRIEELSHGNRQKTSLPKFACCFAGSPNQAAIRFAEELEKIRSWSRWNHPDPTGQYIMANVPGKRIGLLT